MIKWQSTCLTADQQQFSNLLKAYDDNLHLRSNCQNQPQQDFVKGQLCFVNISNDLKKESEYHNFGLYICYSHSLKMWRSAFKSKDDLNDSGVLLFQHCVCIYLIFPQYLSSIFPVKNLSIIAGILQGNYLQLAGRSGIY